MAERVIQEPFTGYAVWRGTAADTESDWYELPGGVGRVDVLVEDAPLLLRLRVPGKGIGQQLKVLDGMFYSVDAAVEAFTVQNATAGANATWQVVAWTR